MAAYQVKRLIRNRAVPTISRQYERMIRATAATCPSPAHCDRIPSDLANFIGSYYHHTDAEMHDAARGRFTVLGRTVDFEYIAAIDWDYRHPDEKDIYLWRLKLSHLELLHSLVASGDPTHHKTAVALINSFVRSRNFASGDAFSSGWSPYGASHRLLALLSGMSIAMRQCGIADDARTDFEEFARLEAGFLWRNIEHELRNNHTERNLAALCLYYLAAGSISPARAKVLDRDVRRIIRQTVLDDGMQVERSAMYQGLTVMSLRIFSACPFLASTTRELASKRTDAATRAWLFLTHRDGEIALFNDSWMSEVPSPAAIIDPEKFRIPPALPNAGYFRLSAGAVDAIFDSGEIGPRCSPAHGHADFLAIEVDVSGRRFVVDPGTSQYSMGPRRAFERSSASHNGPQYRGVEPVQYFGAFRVGKLNRTISPLPTTLLSRLSFGAVGGQFTTSVGPCTRVLCAAPSGGIVVVDHWASPEPRGVTRLLIPDEWHINAKDPASMHAEADDAETTLTIYHGQFKEVEAALWSRYHMRTEEANSIVLEPARRASGQLLVFGVGVIQPSEIPDIRAQVEGHVLNHKLRKSSARP